jgi:hypothetical protein
MRLKLNLGLMLLLAWTAMTGPRARAQADDSFSDHVLVSAEQGQALAEFVLQSGPRVRPKPDCSHLVHLLYARAGLVYPYENSRVLYRGVESFERVKTPQPGDLVVWIGHVGVVLSPEDTTFLSSVRSGVITETWKAKHWVRRGRPHFFRYRIGPDANSALLAAIMSPEGDAQNGSRSNLSATSDAQLSFPAAEQNTLKDHGPEESGAQAERDTRGLQEEQHDLTTDETGQDSDSIVAVIHQRQTPIRQEIVAAIMENSNARARSLVGGEMLDLDHPMSVFDRMEVSRIKLKHESGSITLKLTEIMSQEAGKILPPKTMERELLIRRKDGVWVISDPRARTYLPRTQALKVFERQAELFLQRAPNSSGTRAVVKALDRLYDQYAGNPQRAAVK